MFLKFQLIDSSTGLPSQNSNNLVSPSILNLSVSFASIINGITWFYGTCDDNAKVTSTSYLIILDSTTWIQECQAAFNSKQQLKYQQIYTIASNKLDNLTQNYNTIELVDISTKYQQAVAANQAATDADARTAAPLLVTEAATRQITVKQLATDIIAKYMSFIDSKAKILGYRGLLCDSLAKIVFDNTNPVVGVQGIQNLNIVDNWPV